MSAKLVPTVQPSWNLKEFDTGTVVVGQEGPGEMQDSGGPFPNGRMIGKMAAKR